MITETTWIDSIAGRQAIDLVTSLTGYTVKATDPPRPGFSIDYDDKTILVPRELKPGQYFAALITALCVILGIEADVQLESSLP